jgi:signal peptidase I
MPDKPFDKLPTSPDEPPVDDAPRGVSGEPSQMEGDRGEAQGNRPEPRPSPARRTSSSSGERFLPSQTPWDGNEHAIVVAAGQPTAGAEAAPSSEAALGARWASISVTEAPPVERRKPAWLRVGRITRELVETLILALLIFLAVRAAVQNFQVEGSSMDPGLRNGEFLLVNKLLYAEINLDAIDRFIPFIDLPDGSRHIFRAPQRGDVIVFRFPRDPTRDFIKRIIGVPGDTVEVRNGTVFIDGQPLEEPYLTYKANYSSPPVTVPAGHYFVLGDNRPGSFDSHSWTSYEPSPDWEHPPFVPEENIIGQAWLSYWPFEDWGLVPNKTLNPTPQ